MKMLLDIGNSMTKICLNKGISIKNIKKIATQNSQMLSAKKLSIIIILNQDSFYLPYQLVLIFLY